MFVVIVISTSIVNTIVIVIAVVNVFTISIVNTIVIVIAVVNVFAISIVIVIVIVIVIIYSRRRSRQFASKFKPFLEQSL